MRRAPLGRALILALTLGGALGVPLLSATAAASPCSPSNPCLAVHLPDGSVDYAFIPAIRADAAAAQGQPNGVADGTNYPQLTPGGGDAGVVTVSDAVSVNALVAPLLASLNPPVAMSSVTFTDMPRSDGSWSILPAAELTARPSGFADPTLLPAYYAPVGQNNILYARPLLNSTDSNLGDNGVSSFNTSNGELDLFVRTGPLLTVTASASVLPPKTAKIGQPISFTSSSSGTAAKVSYAWTVNGAQQVSSQQNFTYSFPAAGTYELQVTASGSDDSAGTATPIFITVGTTHFRGTPSPGTSATPTPTPTATAKPTPTLTSTPLPTVSKSAPAVTSSSPTAGSAGGHKGGTATGAPQRSSPPSPPAHAANGLPLVRGRLIGQSAALLLTTTGPAADESSVGVSPSSRLSVGWRAAALVGSIAVIMLLFVAGAARELRWSRRGRGVVRPQ
jgi:hypothetical protein